MTYINKGDLLEVDGSKAIATSGDYTRLVYDHYDYDLMRAGYEGGTAMRYVNVLYPETASTTSVPLHRVKKVA